MGGCVSLQKEKDHPRGRKRDRRQGFRTRFKGLPLEEEAIDGNLNGDHGQSGRRTLGFILNEKEPSHQHQKSLGSTEENWYDAEARFTSDSDDEFMSVCGDFSSAANSLNPPSVPTTPRPTLANLKEEMLRVDTVVSPKTANGFAVADEHLLSSKLHPEEDKKSSVSLGRRLIDATPRNSSVSVAPVSDASTEFEMGKHASQHQQQAKEFEGCLPCLLTSVSFEKKSPQRRRSFRLFSFKRRSDVNDSFELHDMSKVLHRPIAATQVPMSDGSVEGSWSRICPSTFKLRSRNYMKDKKKQAASKFSIFEAAGVDVFLSPKKIDHVARFVDLSHIVDGNPEDKFPSLFIFNIQVPMYSASMFPAENNGEGLNLVFYYRMSEEFKRNGPPYLKDMLSKLLDDEQEKVRGLVGETIVSFRERLKIVARVLNPDEIHLSAPEKRLVVTSNEKPVLSRPQHSFHKGPGYLEVDLDVHRFNFIARKAVESFRERLKLCVLDIGLTIQGNKAEELPEQMLCCARINRLNVGSYKYLSCEDDAAGTPRSRRD
ncbi:uncharacterized protein LOC9657679 [Selaginella moellendorffii]|nr:uncharacterized protein LOC9657679 [Selaginella moellendorffii]|eukprot:XP_002974273.2 uncharacterized protein LOC9657679 [Selaginella moellendorffii]